MMILPGNHLSWKCGGCAPRAVGAHCCIPAAFQSAAETAAKAALEAQLAEQRAASPAAAEEQVRQIAEIQQNLAHAQTALEEANAQAAEKEAAAEAAKIAEENANVCTCTVSRSTCANHSMGCMRWFDTGWRSTHYRAACSCS